MFFHPRLVERARIRREYIELRNAYRGMVGTLYPSIAYSRLEELRALYVADLEPNDFWADLPYVIEPNVFGQSRQL